MNIAVPCIVREMMRSYLINFSKDVDERSTGTTNRSIANHWNSHTFTKHRRAIVM